MAELAVPEEILPLLNRMGRRLVDQRRKHQTLGKYRDGGSPIPAAITKSRTTKSYRLLMPQSEAPWGDLVVGSTLDRLEMKGLRDEKQSDADEVWGMLQENQLDLESKIVHDACLTDGRAAALVWPEEGEDTPTITFDSMATMCVMYEPGSRRKRRAAMRHWIDDSQPYANIYTRDGIYKFKGPRYSSGFDGTQWTRFQPPGDEEWPVRNPYNVVPVVEFGINRRLRPGVFPFARGEYEHCIGLLDRINLLTFLGLVVAFYMGFPLRGVLGARILKDDAGDPIAPFDASAPGVFQFEDPEAQIAEFKAADRANLSIFPDLAQLAMITKTPRHYFPMEGGMANLAADAIRASEGALHAKVSNYQPSLGESWEETARVLGAMTGHEISQRATIDWVDHESRSLAERADAASKLKDVVPSIAIAEKVLDWMLDDWRRWQAENQTAPLAGVVKAVVDSKQQGAAAELAQAQASAASVGNGGNGAQSSS